MTKMMIGLVAALLIVPAGTTEVRAAQTQAQQEMANVEAQRAAERAAALRQEAEAVAAAQARARAEREQAARSEAERVQAARAQAEREQAARAARGAAPSNVKLDITITDQTGAGQVPIKKTMTMLLADGSNGSVRSSGMVHQQIQAGSDAEGKPRMALRPLFEVQLNVDAAVHVLQDDHMRVRITLEYTPGMSPLVANEPARPSPLNESVTVILQNGKPLVITQAADPVTDRKISVEVTGTILR